MYAFLDNVSFRYDYWLLVELKPEADTFWDGFSSVFLYFRLPVQKTGSWKMKSFD